MADSEARGEEQKTVGGLCPVGRVLACERQEGGLLLTLGGGAQMRIRFWGEEVARVSFDPEGRFEDPAKGKILAEQPSEPPRLRYTEGEGFRELATERVTVRIRMDPLTLAAALPDGAPYFAEAAPLQYCADEGQERTVQTLAGAKDEYFFGCGMQNGFFSHKGRRVPIELRNTHWNAGAASNPAPFYWSSRGYGMLRNTFATGEYAFLEQTVLTQNEAALDAFWFFGGTPAGVLDLYTALTGRPRLLPRWGLMPGDANCYKETMDALKTVEDYEANDFPRGWILPNDGYGCGYTDLRGFIGAANARGFRVGLWTENSVDKIAAEVRDCGSRAVKTDVAWVGPGYEFALDGVKTSCEGIERNSDARGYVWTCCGWAGTQRYSAVWSGDQFGNWEYIRMHIPTYLGSGLSGEPFCGSDVDGIFAGGPETQVRDLQWKCFSPILIFMSGWSPKNKQPWIHGEPYASINRRYLRLRLRLTPYLYSLARQASETGAPVVRPVFWHYPNEVYAYTRDTQYEYLLGESFLVAPIYENACLRDAIYLPGGEDERWIDYHTGDVYSGGQVLNSFPAPLEKLPVFVRAGSVIPLYPLGRFDGDVLPDETHPLTFDIYPRGAASATLYEDDGSSRAYRDGAFAETDVRVRAPEEGTGTVRAYISPARGSYAGMNTRRRYELLIHTRLVPTGAAAGGEALPRRASRAEYDAAVRGWWYDPETAGGVCYIRTRAYSVCDAAEIAVEGVCVGPAAQAVVDDAIPAVPENLSVREAQDRRLVLGWDDAPGAAWYDLLIDGLLFTHVQNPYAHRELDCDAPHTYRVRGFNTRGPGEWSAAVEGRTLVSSLRDALGEEDIARVSASSERPGYDAGMAVNGDGESFWRTSEKDGGELPASFTIELKNAFPIDRFTYRSREKGTRGNITRYRLEFSVDGAHYKEIAAGDWEDQDGPHDLSFPAETAQFVRVEALEGVGGSANAVHFIPYRAGGPVLPGNYTGGDAVDDNDLTFLRNYIGVMREDNDWGYVRKCDVNCNGMIDAYDLAFVARRLGGTLAHPVRPQTEGEEPAAGAIRIETPRGPVRAGETFEVRVLGEGLRNVWAFHAMLSLDEAAYEHLNCTGRCKKEVVARSGGLSAGMVNACAVKSDENGAKIVVAFTQRGEAAGVAGDGELAVFTLRARRDADSVELPVISTLLVGTGLDERYGGAEK